MDETRSQRVREQATAAVTRALVVGEYARVVAMQAAAVGGRLARPTLEDLLDHTDAYRKFAARWSGIAGKKDSPGATVSREFAQLALYAADEITGLIHRMATPDTQSE
jgi:hypothetical protein